MDTLAQILQFLQNLVYRDTSGKPYIRVNVDNFSEANSTLASVSEITATEDGDISEGALFIEIVTSEDFEGTIGGLDIPGLVVKTYPFIQGFKYPEIEYTISEGELYITTVTK